MATHNGICDSFNQLQWHDSKVLGFCILHKEDRDDIAIEVEIRGVSALELTPATVVLEDAAFFFCDLDLHAKRECADDISSAECSEESELKSMIQQQRLEYTPGALKDYLHFSFRLIAPGGTLDVFARRYSLNLSSEKEAKS